MKTGIEKSNCSGCDVCSNVCPVDAISYETDEFGFKYPVFAENCIDCGLCERTCPNNKANLSRLALNAPISAYSAVSKDSDCLKNSASGGAFSEIVDAFCGLEQDYAVFGVKFDESFNAVTDFVCDKSQIAPFRKSKYIQSSPNSSYRKVEKFLKDGKKVLFTGTPCQVAALKLFLKKDYDNLLAVDILCAGFASPMVFKKYVEHFEKKMGAKLVSYSFREKRKSLWRYSALVTRMEFANGKSVENFIDSYYRGFIKGLYFCDACPECRYAGPKRTSDITIGDFWSIGKIDASLNPMKGVSLILANTEKGVETVKKLSRSMDITERSTQSAIIGNAPLNSPLPKNPRSADFFKLLKDHDVVYCINRVAPPPPFRKRVMRKLSRILKLIFKFGR